MDTENTEKKPKRVRRNYKQALDVPLAKVQRKVAVALVMENNTKEVAKTAGTGGDYVQQSFSNGAIIGGKVSGMLAQSERLQNLLTELENIIEQQPETPLKYSDKLKAIEIVANLTGLSKETKGDTYTFNKFELSQSTAAELEAELAKIEEAQRSAVAEGHDDVIDI